MQENIGQFDNSFGYFQFLKDYKYRVLAIIVAAAAVRLIAFQVFGVSLGGDSIVRYIPTALNLINGNGFSLDISLPFTPSEAALPLYPMFIASIYKIFGPQNFIIVVAQFLLDLINLLMIGFISFNLVSEKLRNLTAAFAMFAYAGSWMIFIYINFVLTEILTVFLMLLTIVFCIFAIKKKSVYWIFAGFICGLVMMIRPDSVLFLTAICLFLGGQFLINRTRQNFLNGLFFTLTVIFIMSPWTIRNYIQFEKFQPMSSESGWANQDQDYFPRGYLEWTRTWMTDESCYWTIFNPVFSPRTEPIKLCLPDDFYDSEEEKQKVAKLVEDFNKRGFSNEEMDLGFAQIARERIQRNPFRYYVKLPLQRVVSLWLTGLNYHRFSSLIIRITSVLPIILGGIFGFMMFGRKSSLGWILFLIMAVRTIFLAFHYAPENRYIVEAYPPMIALSGGTFAWIWQFLDSIKNNKEGK